MTARRAARYGDLAEENVDVLILYGKALLRTAVASSGVFGPGKAPATTSGEQAEGASSSASQYSGIHCML